MGPPPPVTGDFRFYADITPVTSLYNAFAVVPDGRVALAASAIAPGTVAGVPFTHFGPGVSDPNLDLLVAMLDASGKTAWWKTFGTAESEVTQALAADEKGDLYLAGAFGDNLDGIDFGDGVAVGIGKGQVSSFLVKLSGADGKALWAISIQSGDDYVKPYCSPLQKELAVRGGLGAIACRFDGGDGTRKLKVVTKAGETDVAPASADVNSLVLVFDPASGEPTGTYVIGGAQPYVFSLAITDNGGMVLGGKVDAGTLTDSAGSEPLVIAAQGCFLASLGADMKPVARRTFSGGVGSDCSVDEVALAGPDRVVVGGNAVGDVDFGDGAASAGEFGFTGVLGADLANAGAFERFVDERVFGVATDVWGQSFVGVAVEGKPPSLRYTKRDAAGKVVWESKAYGPEMGDALLPLKALSLETDGSGALTIFGTLMGVMTLDDGAHGGADDMHFFALRFAP